MRVRPRSGLLIRDPVNPAAPLPDSGADVPRTTYWIRRLLRGDVELLSDRDALRRTEHQAQPEEPEVLP